MEGLLIHALLRGFKEELPAQFLGLAFPDEASLALLLKGRSGRIFNLVLRYRPPSPSLALEEGRVEGEAKNALQRFLEARLKGRLLEAEQLKLDRVVFLRFSGERGFVDTPPATLVLEATGRNANLLLLDEKGQILAVDRPIGREVNRYRELRPGLPYTPPPPYEKLDPRALEGPEALRPLLGRPLKEVGRFVDGIGKELTQELARRLGQTPEPPLKEEGLSRLHRALKALVEDPGLRTELTEELRQRWAEEEKEALRKPLLEALRRERKTLLARLGDYREALERAKEAEELRGMADLLLAYLHRVPKGAETVELPGFDGKPVTIPLDPNLTPQANAQKLYERAKKLEALAQRARELIPKTEARLKALEEEIQKVEGAGLEELFALLKKPREKKPLPGLRYETPGGFTVLVGRNAKENELLLRLAGPEDLWFHAQGAPGSHVILKTEGKNPSLEDLLFAASLAAYHSKLRGEKNAPVDYTRRKWVHKPRKAPPGQVLYTGAKTLFVEGKLPKEAQEG